MKLDEARCKIQNSKHCIVNFQTKPLPQLNSGLLSIISLRFLYSEGGKS